MIQKVRTIDDIQTILGDSSAFTNDVNRLRDEVRSLIEGNEQDHGIIEFGFAPRLLETLLQASYLVQYIPGGERFVRENKLVEKSYDATFTRDVGKAPDQQLQYLLLELFNIDSQWLDVRSYLQSWLERYDAILETLFEPFDLDQTKYVRKIVTFYLVALFMCVDPQVRKLLRQFLFKKVSQHNPSSYREQIQTADSWRRIYYYLFYFLTNSSNDPETSSMLENLFNLQNRDGSWQKNNFLTLVVVHSLKFLELENVFPDSQQFVLKTESYLLSHKSGMSVLDSMAIYDTAMYYLFRLVFEGVLPHERFVSYLIHAQLPDGGWAHQPDIQLSDIDTTVFVLLLLLPSYHDSEVVRVVVRDGVQFLNAMENDGNVGMYLNEDGEILPEMIARALMLVSYLPPELITDEERVRRVMTYLCRLKELQDPSGPFKYFAYSYSDLYAILQVQLAFLFLKHSHHCQEMHYNRYTDPVEEKFRTYLKCHQNNNGSYSAFSFPQGEQQSSLYALLTLTLLNMGQEQKRAAQWVTEFVSQKGVQSYPEGTGLRPIRYNDLSHGPIFLYMSLSATLTKVGIFPGLEVFNAEETTLEHDQAFNNSSLQDIHRLYSTKLQEGGHHLDNQVLLAEYLQLCYPQSRLNTLDSLLSPFFTIINSLDDMIDHSPPEKRLEFYKYALLTFSSNFLLFNNLFSSVFEDQIACPEKWRLKSIFKDLFRMVDGLTEAALTEMNPPPLYPEESTSELVTKVLAIQKARSFDQLFVISLVKKLIDPQDMAGDISSPFVLCKALEFVLKDFHDYPIDQELESFNIVSYLRTQLSLDTEGVRELLGKVVEEVTSIVQNKISEPTFPTEAGKMIMSKLKNLTCSLDYSGVPELEVG